MERGLWQAIATRQIFPVLCGDALSNVGVDQLLSAVASCFPPPPYKARDSTTLALRAMKSRLLAMLTSP